MGCGELAGVAECHKLLNCPKGTYNKITLFTIPVIVILLILNVMICMLECSIRPILQWQQLVGFVSLPNPILEVTNHYTGEIYTI